MKKFIIEFTEHRRAEVKADSHEKARAQVMAGLSRGKLTDRRITRSSEPTRPPEIELRGGW